MEVVWLFSWGTSCLMYKDSRIGRCCGLEVWAMILKSEYDMLWLHELLCERMALFSLVLRTHPVLWLTPLCESMRTFNRRFVHPTYVPKLHFGQEYLYITEDRINSGSVSLNENKELIVSGFLKTNLKSTYGYKLPKTLVSSRFKLPALEENGKEIYSNFFGAVKMRDLGWKILARNLFKMRSTKDLG